MSGEFLNGTSAQYKLCSAKQMKRKTKISAL